MLPGHLHFQELSLPFFFFFALPPPFLFLSPSALQVWTNVITDPCRRPARETEAGPDTQVFQTGYIRPNRPSVYLCNWTLRIRRRRFQAKWASYCLFGINYQGEWKPRRPRDTPPPTPRKKEPIQTLEAWMRGEGECLTRAMATELGTVQREVWSGSRLLCLSLG